MNCGTRFDVKLHPARCPFLMLVMILELRISTVDNFGWFSAYGKFCPSFIQQPGVLNGAISLIKRKETNLISFTRLFSFLSPDPGKTISNLHEGTEVPVPSAPLFWLREHTCYAWQAITWREVIWKLFYLLRWYQQREPAIGGRERRGAVSPGLCLRLLV